MTSIARDGDSQRTPRKPAMEGLSVGRHGQPELISALFGARVPVFSTTHYAEIAKLALSGLKQVNFYAPFAEKNNGTSRCRA